MSREPVPKTIPNPLWCERCQGRGYLVADAEWEPYAVQCSDCADRRPPFKQCTHFKEGDNGQRYEVRAVGMQGTEFVVGWTPHPDGGGLARTIERHPVWALSRIIDRRRDDGEEANGA